MSGFPALYLRFLPAVRAKARRMLGEGQDAEDIVSEAFLRLWQSGPPLNECCDVRRTLAWLYRTCTHLAIDHLRRQRTIDDPHQLDEVLPSPNVTDAMVAARKVIQSLQRRVQPNELAVAILCRLDDCSQPEAAEILGVSERTVRRLLERFDAQSEQLRKDFVS